MDKESSISNASVYASRLIDIIAQQIDVRLIDQQYYDLYSLYVHVCYGYKRLHSAHRSFTHVIGRELNEYTYDIMYESSLYIASMYDLVCNKPELLKYKGTDKSGTINIYKLRTEVAEQHINIMADVSSRILEHVHKSEISKSHSTKTAKAGVLNKIAGFIKNFGVYDFSKIRPCESNNSNHNIDSGS